MGRRAMETAAAGSPRQSIATAIALSFGRRSISLL
jgi:hypothetical protein